MDLITALALVIGVMGGIATAVWLQLVIGGTTAWVIWVTFIGWASFYAAGGGNDGLMKSVAANVWGALVAAISLIAFTKTAGTPLWAGICVGVAIIVLIMGAKIPALGFIPGQVFGYAPTAGLFLGGVAAFGDLILASVLSLVIGNVLGIISQKIGGAVAKS